MQKVIFRKYGLKCLNNIVVYNQRVRGQFCWKSRGIAIQSIFSQKIKAYEIYEFQTIQIKSVVEFAFT